MVKDAREGLRPFSSLLIERVLELVPNLPKGVEVFLQKELNNELLFSTLDGFMEAYKAGKIDSEQRALIIAALEGKIKNNRDLIYAFFSWMNRNEWRIAKRAGNHYKLLWYDLYTVKKKLGDEIQPPLFE